MAGLQERIDYHSARALEELDCAERSRQDEERRLHMKLSRLHLIKAEWLRSERLSVSDDGAPRSMVLDMAQASRVVDFHEFHYR